MTTLLAKIESGSGRNAADMVERFFEAAALPIPEKGEFFVSEDSGTFVLLNDEACLLRLVGPAMDRSSRAAFPKTFQPLAVDEDILQPFGVKTLAPTLQLEIVPGIQCGLSDAWYETLIRRLHRKKMGFAVTDDIDLAYRNGGTLPNGKGVILDRGAVRQRNAPSPATPVSLGAQDKFFGPLREVYNGAAWPAGENPNEKGFAELWTMSREMKGEKILVPGWLEQKGYDRTKDIVAASTNYQTRRNGTVARPVLAAA